MAKILILLFLLCPALSYADKTHAQIAEEYGNTIVSVNVAKKNGATHSGTGFIVHHSGLIATAGHVVRGAAFVNVTFKNGAVSEQAKIVEIIPNEEIDLALIKLDLNDLPTVVFKNSDFVRAGDEITVIGNPRRLQNTITNGLVSQIRKMGQGVIWHQISAPISPSSSGSPVFDRNGAVIGVALSSLKGKDNQNLNFAIPSNYLMQLMLDNMYEPEFYSKKQLKPQQAYSGKMSFWQLLKNHMKKSWAILSKKFLSWWY